MREKERKTERGERAKCKEKSEVSTAERLTSARLTNEH